MKTPLQFTFRNIDNTPSIEERIRDKVKKLEQHVEGIVSCHIVLELIKAHPHHGKIYNVRIRLHLPGKELMVNQNAEPDLYLAIRDAFDDLLRQAKAY